MMSSAYECYRSMPWTTDRDPCEADCGTVMGEGRYAEGRYGHYCSERCRAEVESGGPTDDEDRYVERRQMGAVGY